MKKSKDAKKRLEVKAKDKSLDVDRIARSSRFEAPIPTGPDAEPHRKFFIFRMPGDEIEGVLGHPITNIRRNTSYPLKLTQTVHGNEYYKEGDTVEIFGNKLLHNVIRDNELIGARVLIRYIGWQRIPGVTKPRKIYRVFKIEGFEKLQQQPKTKKRKE